MKRAIVTGATGFIGQHLVNALNCAGYQVCALLRSARATPALQEYDSVKTIQCDMSDYTSEKTLAALSGFSGADLFFHLAWEGSAGEKRSDYALQLQNARYACDAVDLASRLGCGRFIGAGSIMEDECEALVPLNGSRPPATYHYSIAKYTAFLMTKTEAARRQMPFCWGKISNGYGQTDTTQRFMNTMLRKMLRNEPCALTQSEQIYDFVYVTEIARAFLLIGENGKPGTSYYIGSGQPQPLREFVLAMHALTQSQSELRFGAVPYTGVYLKASAFDATALAADTGFVCAVPFEEGVRKTILWLNHMDQGVV